MLWIAGSLTIVLWLTLKFVFHKSGMVHVWLLLAASMFIIQFVQDIRTKAYERSNSRPTKL
jgi:hypothetical protein